jgi:hypothetical protein
VDLDASFCLVCEDFNCSYKYDTVIDKVWFRAWHLVVSEPVCTKNILIVAHKHADICKTRITGTLRLGAGAFTACDLDVMAYRLTCFYDKLLWIFVCFIWEMVVGYIEVLAKLFLEEFVQILWLSTPSFTGRAGHNGMSAVDVKVALGLVDEARVLYREATGVASCIVKQLGLSLLRLSKLYHWWLSMP